MLIAGREAIRDVILFPTLRPEGHEGADGSAAVSAEGAPTAADSAPPPRRRGRRRHRAPRTGQGLAPPAARARCAPLAWAGVIVAIFSVLPTATSLRFSLDSFSLRLESTRAGGATRISVVIGLVLIGGRPRAQPGQAPGLGDRDRRVRRRRDRHVLQGPGSARGAAVGWGCCWR